MAMRETMSHWHMSLPFEEGSFWPRRFLQAYWSGTGFLNSQVTNSLAVCWSKTSILTVYILVFVLMCSHDSSFIVRQGSDGELLLPSAPRRFNKSCCQNTKRQNSMHSKWAEQWGVFSVCSAMFLFVCVRFFPRTIQSTEKEICINLKKK